MTKRRIQGLLCLLLAAASAAPALADDLDEVRKLRDTTIALVNALVDQGVLSREKADELIRKAEQAGKKPAGAPAVAAVPGSGGATASGPGRVALRALRRAGAAIAGRSSASCRRDDPRKTR